MNLQISEHVKLEGELTTIKIFTDERFLCILVDWLTPYIKRELKKASVTYETVGYREAFDQVLVKEEGPRADRFQIYQELIDYNPAWDLAGVNDY